MAAPAPETRPADPDPLAGIQAWLSVYGPRLAIFAAVVGVAVALALLYRRLQAQEAAHIGMQMDRILAMPEDQGDPRIAALRQLQASYPGSEQEPWVLLALGSQLFRKAQSLPPSSPEAPALLQEAYGLFNDVAERHPAHHAAPLALLSAGCAAEEAGRDTDAKRLYGELQRRYPLTYLVTGGGGSGSLQSYLSEGLSERIGKLRKAFPAEAPPPS